MDEKFNARNKKRHKFGYSENRIIDSIDSNENEYLIRHAHDKREKVSQCAHYISLVTRMTDKAISPEFIYLSS